ncbi:MAG: hypothetical protein ACRDV9_08165, partial [Acidimicrobiia bacterium]
MEEINAGAGPHDRAIVASMSWRVSMERAEQVDFIVVESEAKILDVQANLGVERLAARFTSDDDRLKDGVRFITSFHVPDFAERMIGGDVPSGLLIRNPVRRAGWLRNLETRAVTWVNGAESNAQGGLQSQGYQGAHAA